MRYLGLLRVPRLPDLCDLIRRLLGEQVSSVPQLYNSLLWRSRRAVETLASRSRCTTSRSIGIMPPDPAPQNPAGKPKCRHGADRRAASRRAP
jgi:hypothetical protein